MKFIKFILFILTIIIVSLIYKYNKKDTFSYVSIGDDLSNYNKYLYDDYTYIKISNLNELRYMILNNDIVGDKNILNIIYNADLITISTLYNDINDIELLFDTITKYNNNIIFTGYYNIDDNLNNDINKLCLKYNIKYIDLNNLFKNNNKYLYLNYPYPNTDGYKLIANKIKNNCE